jgi:hypothetical protein
MFGFPVQGKNVKYREYGARLVVDRVKEEAQLYFGLPSYSGPTVKKL